MKKSPIEIINLSFSVFMVLLTFGGAMIFLFTDLLSDRIYETKRIVLAVLFLVYSFYRGYRIYNLFKKKEDL